MTKPVTDLIHHPYQPPAGFSAPQPGVFKASTVLFANTAALRARDWRHKNGYTYGLHGTPTTFQLEERIATLEGGLQCVLVPSGLAAIANVGMTLLKAGDEVLLPDNVYGPSRALAEGEFKGWGITHQLYDPLKPADLEARIGPNTRLVWLEAPGSVTMEFPDLPELVRICRRKGVTCALDNTWGAGLAFQAFDLAPG
ncbi:MAG TPA: PLP-dependent transferase, partial [Ramlibacter sp.]|uniref:PLP-dependent transferase n=1 Tax=Ramlibacter sp. TaxID=1917967 RepID=UPI002D7FC088